MEIEQLRLLKDLKKDFIEKFIKETHRMKNLAPNAIARQHLLIYGNNVMEFYECFMHELQKCFCNENDK
jgi:hypothetical protein